MSSTLCLRRNVLNRGDWKKWGVESSKEEERIARSKNDFEEENNHCYRRDLLLDFIL